MFKYNVPFETIIGLESFNPIIRFINENINKDDRIVICYEPMKDNMPSNLIKLLALIEKKLTNIKINVFACHNASSIDINQLNVADVLIACGSYELINGLNRSGFDKNIPIIVLESETAAMNALNCIYIENGTFNHCKFNRNIVADNSSLTFIHDDFNRLDNNWMFALSLINILKNDHLNPLLRANYAACVDFLSWFIHYENKDNKNTKNQLIVLKKGIACFYNAFNNDVDNEINKKILGEAKTFKEFKVNCVKELIDSFESLKKLPQYTTILDKYNIPHQEIDDAVKFYTPSAPKGDK